MFFFFLYVAVPLSVWKGSSRMQARAIFFSLRQSAFPWLLKRISALQTSLWLSVAQRLEAHLWAQLRPFTASRSLSTLCRMPTLTPTCLLFEMYFQQLLSQWGLNMRQDVFCPFFKSEIFFFCWSAFQGCIFFSNMEPLWGEELGFLKVSFHWPVTELQKLQLCSYFLTLAGSQVEMKICWVHVPSIDGLASTSLSCHLSPDPDKFSPLTPMTSKYI